MTALVALLKVAGPAVIVAVAKVLPDLVERWLAGAADREAARRREADDALREALAAGDVRRVEDALGALGV